MFCPFLPDELHELPGVISAPRFATYLQHMAQDQRRALELYRWNLEISAALLIPLHRVEVALRNAVSDAITAVHGANWPWNAGFTISLPSGGVRAYSPKADLARCAATQPTTGQVIAELKFAFWEKMLTKRHDARLGAREFGRAFPNAPTGQAVTTSRSALRADVEAIRGLRNRIAHHEPIFARPLADDLATIMRSIAWRSRTAADWVRSIETVTSLIAVRP